LVFFREHEGSITIEAHEDAKKAIQMKNAYENVLEYYMFLKWFWFFDKFKFFSPEWEYKKIIHLIKKTLKFVGLFDSTKKIYGKMHS